MTFPVVLSPRSGSGPCWEVRPQHFDKRIEGRPNLLRVLSGFIPGLDRNEASDWATVQGQRDGLTALADIA